MDIFELVRRAQDNATVTRVFGEPVTQDGVTVIPVAKISGGGGAGTGKKEGDRPGQGSGGGFGVGAVPLGVLVVKDGKVRWQPIVDVNRVILGGQVVVIAALLTVRTLIRLRARDKGRREG